MAAQEKSAGVVIFRREGKSILFLLLFKKYKSEYYDLVKGHYEKGEEAIDAARREAKEEAGIEDLHFLPGYEEKISWWYRFEGKLTRKVVTYYLAETKTKDVKISVEHIRPEWQALEKAEKLIKHKETRELLRKAQAFLNKREKEGLGKFL